MVIIKIEVDQSINDKPKDDTALVNYEIDLIRKKHLNLKSNRIFFCKFLKKHIKTDRDYIMCASSFEGEGKSTYVISGIGFTVEKCDTREKKLEFLKNNVVYDPTGGELIKTLKNIKNKSILIVDEAQKLLYKRNYQTSERKDLNILFSTIRQKNLIVIFCIPDFYDLDIYFRNWRIKTWAYVPTRDPFGLAVIWKKSNSPFSKDKWEQKRNEKLIELIEERANEGRLLGKNEIIKAFRKLKSYGLEMSFDDWNDDVVKETYLRYKEWGGTKPPEEVEEEQTKDAKKFKDIAIALKASGKTNEEISKLIGRAERTVREYVKGFKIESKKEEPKKESKDDPEIKSDSFRLL